MVPLTCAPSELVTESLLMVPRATVMVTGAVGEMAAPPSAGDAVTAATGAGSAVVEGELDEPADDGADAFEAVPVDGPAVPPCSIGSPVEPPEQAAVRASSPAAITATAARRADLIRCTGM